MLNVLAYFWPPKKKEKPNDTRDVGTDPPEPLWRNSYLKDRLGKVKDSSMVWLGASR
jgi:hypothetical protein